MCEEWEELDYYEPTEVEELLEETEEQAKGAFKAKHQSKVGISRKDDYEDHHGKERKINMKKYIEAKIDGEWCIIDQMDITEDATFSIQNENGDPTYYKIDDYELRIVRYEN